MSVNICGKTTSLIVQNYLNSPVLIKKSFTGSAPIYILKRENFELFVFITAASG